ncbi:MAG: sigma-54-dependent Fis family transcriptional regulator [Thiohalocapsa sp.]|jgi:transcriptional regulator with GAF, ATPase, and Fis domain|uniref:sigma-54-dependent Fis family transcriptional regulator n=1 Tax=Thiohalocapsa sp. TaxID=2497641 RepID=UPI0025CB9692|nr:sigma-54-dependent Fis family transcriptional regulator [Thiohalocapsa sp.]MCG6942814.1 sigma-54-dependent Fis family transcriptional regulator [Thiohalocapsa sp.]
MEHFQPILLEVWRRACRQPHLAEAVSGITEILQRRLPLDRLVVLVLDQGHARLRTAAAAGEGVAHADPEPPSNPAQERLLRWCAEESLLRGPADEIARRLPGLLPPGWTGGILASGLRLADEPLGVLVLGATGVDAFQARHEPLMAALREPIAVALRNDHQLRELTSLREAAEADRRSLLSRLGRQDITDTLIGAGTGLKDVMRGVQQVARSGAPVLILGETGSGKEVIARAIHTGSARPAGPFLRVNCGAIPPDLADSELFGHERGSFTGAAGRRKGWFERADGGTLFLDEIGELTPAVQVRLLRILQDGTFERVGGQQQLRVDVRLVAATHRDLQAMVRDGRFREDLWYRINVFPLRLPALRERREDIPAMASHFALRAAERLGLTPRLPTPADMTRLLAYPWPGNVRELSAVIERAAILGEGHKLEIERALGTGTSVAPVQTSAPVASAQSGIESLDSATRRHIEQALASTFGRIQGPFGAARLLQVHPDTLRARMRKLGIDRGQFIPR